MAKPAKVYYTFKVVNLDPLKLECHKWEREGEHTGTIYKVEPTMQFRGCDCPAWKNNCKHMKCAKEIVESGKLDELWKWRWDEKAGWQQLDDIPTVEDLGL